jgi:hypothetical protein
MEKYAIEVHELNPTYNLSINFKYNNNNLGYVLINVGSPVNSIYVTPNPFPDQDSIK